MGEEISFKRPDGGKCSGYYAHPAGGGKFPAILVIQEWWGLDDHIKSVVDRIAAAGYRALAPDLYRGKVTLEAAEAAHLMAALDFKDAATQDLRGAALHLTQTGTRVGAVGFCLGGALTILTAILVPEVEAASCWYGIPSDEAGDVRTIRIPLQGHFALNDYYFTPAQVDALEAKLKEGNVRYEFYRYPANHAFGNDSSPYYDPESARLACRRTLDFLAKHCKEHKQGTTVV
jgi:carboxymethylenebutenolidase